jgi:hypothetical protein
MERGLKMSDTPMCTWCASTEHTLVDCPIAPKEGVDFVFDADGIAQGIKMVERFREMEDE